MNVKIIEVRDEGTFIPLVCINMQPSGQNGSAAQRSQHYYMRRFGYPCDGQPNIVIFHLNANGDPATNDPFHWRSRTYRVSHDHIIQNWDTLKDGDVVDVQFLLGETKEPKKSERFE